MRTLAGLLAGLLLPALAHAQDARIVAASTTGTPTGDGYAVHRLFDLDEVTTFCAREKVKFKVSVQLAKPTYLAAVYLSLGDPASWKQKPRVKQVFASVYLGDRLVKKIRHKWPDRDEAREGKVNLEASGDSVVLEVDQAYAGKQASAGLCLASLRLEANTRDGLAPVDAADLAALSWTPDQVQNALTHKFTIALGSGTAVLELGKRGKLGYRDDAAKLEIEGRWKLDTSQPGSRRLVFELSRVKAAGKKQAVPEDLARYFAAWRFLAPGEGEAPTFVPWEAFVVDDRGGLGRVAPQSVKP